MSLSKKSKRGIDMFNRINSCPSNMFYSIKRTTQLDTYIKAYEATKQHDSSISEDGEVAGNKVS